MEKVKDGYKMTELGEIPVEWDFIDIDTVSEFVGSGVTPKGGQSVYKDEGIPFIRSQNVYPEGLFLDNVVYIDEEQNEKMKRTQIKDKDILLNITGASIGRCTVVPIGFGRGNVNQHVCIIRAVKKADPEYISIFINSEMGKKQIDSFNGGSSREGLNFQQVRSIKVFIPTLCEQQKISLILSSVDEKIENADNLIEKTKELKKGLMQRLLTKGIGHDRFKDTEIGKIPEEWGIKELGSCVDIRSGNSPSNFKLNDEGEYPFYKVDDMNYTGKYLTRAKVWFDICNYELMTKGMVVFPKRGASIFTNKVAILSKEGYFDTNVMGLNCKEGLENEFLFYLLKFIGLQKFADTTAVPQINNKHINPLIIPIPSFNEQKQIASILSSVDEKIEQYEFRKEKLQELKKGLMQKLLTGKIRVY
ncbi:MAG: restriction endonuclease subunit S [Clostridium sp.]|uniref:restriction endonuclease subunit S n=1 Tax=Clostridium sp. TaxID=1506 RepID=UPI0025BEFDD4|nr:restriction endonuclease subunit S [Clostridium sp.]MCE5221786.1 restriction endonuclease subunit S [Clostridium sp.]